MNTKMIGKAVAGLGLACAIFTAPMASAVAITDTSLGLDSTSASTDIYASSLGFSLDGSDFNIFSTDYTELFLKPGTFLSGSFSIFGTVVGGDLTASLSTSDGWLSGGSLVEASYSSGVFEFVFSDIGGTYAGDYGDSISVIYSDDALSGFVSFVDITSGTDTSSLDELGLTTGDGAADSFAVPVSGTLSLGLIGLAGLAASRKSTTKN